MKILKIFSFVLFVFVFLFIWEDRSFATSPDVIVVRVTPNPEHLSPAKWYAKQGFRGSPRQITVDGYEAIRDGHTVYVNAANATSSNILSANIYVIAFNLGAEAVTNQVFSQILSFVKFNSNITDPGFCSISAASCQEDADCSRGQTCGGDKFCALEEQEVCFYDHECPTSFYCTSPKAKLIRDTKRLSEMENTRELIENYRQAKGYYPRVTAGTYIPNNAISAWPSWRENLSQELNTALPLDPVNKLVCNQDVPNIEQATCWAQDTKRFADITPESSNIDLMAGSLLYRYDVSDDGFIYNFCVPMESDPGKNTYNAINCSQDIAGNSPPIFSGFNLPRADEGEPYIGYIEAYDPDGEPFAWELEMLESDSAECQQQNNDIPCADWDTWDTANTACASPLKLNLGKANSKDHFINTISSCKAGLSSEGSGGRYYFKLTVSDARGGSSSRIFYIRVNPLIIFETPDDLTYVASSANPLSFTIKARSEPDTYPIIYETGGLPRGWEDDFYLNADEAKYYYDVSASFDSSDPNFSNVGENQTVSITLNLQDVYGNTGQTSLNINILNTAPVLENIPNQEIRTKALFDYTVKASDADNNSITYSLVAPPEGITIDANTGQITGSISSSGKYSATVRVRDEYGLTDEKSLNIQVNDYCGDGIIQPTLSNYEGDIVEQCEEAGGGSGESDQYDCAACQWTGGWCGDGAIQADHEDCEAEDLNNQTCELIGYPRGALECGANCFFNEADCIEASMCRIDGELPCILAP